MPGLDNNDLNLPPSPRNLEEDLATNLGIGQVDIRSIWLQTVMWILIDRMRIQIRIQKI